MAVLSKDQLLEKLKLLIGESTTDNSIEIIEDVTDTIDDYETKTKDTTNWEAKYKENDEQWRKKYTERFFNSPAKSEPESNNDDEEKNKPLTYDDLFTNS